jgi:hypothetical protein
MDKYPTESKNRSFGFEWTNSEVNVRRLPELESTHYDYLGENFRKMEVYLSDEVRDQIQKIGWGNLRHYFEYDLPEIASGRSSIDPHDYDDYSQKLRRVGEAEILSRRLNTPIAVKGTGKGLPPGHKDREDLFQQYQFMRRLQLDSQRLLPAQIKEHFRFCPVYGVMRYPNGGIEQYQEWLIMAKVGEGQENGHWVRDVEQGKPRAQGFSNPGFNPEAEPWLVEAFGLNRTKPTWHDLKMKLVNMGLPVSDLAGRNVLWTKDRDGNKDYTIIDQRKK